MNVWIDNSTKAGFEKLLIDHFVKKGVWNHVVYEENETKLMACPWFETKMKELSSYTIIDPEKYNNIYKYLYLFIDMYSRNSALSQDTYDTKSIHEYLNLFNIAINYYYSRFIEEKIDLFIIFRSPHVGLDLIEYLVAKEIGAKTLILEQTLFENKFFYYWDYLDYGDFNTAKQFSPIEKETIESSFEMDLFYMKPTKTSLIKKIKASTPYFFTRSFFLAKKGKLCTILNTHYYNQYRKAKKNLFIPEVDYTKKYVYFAMHLQPEKTTSSWGAEFCDQVLALERLSQIIPDDWCIYVKDNPKQGFFMRDEWFYKRVSLIPKVSFVPDGTNTYQLLKHCVFASTITGTVGWEAIKGGKNVLVFGWGTWYKGFPGVFMYEPGINVYDIANNKINHDELEEKFAILKSKMADGVIYKGYDVMIDSFDINENAKKVISSFEKILNTNL